MPHLQIGWRVSVGAIERNYRHPGWIIVRRTCVDVQLDGMKMSGVNGLDSQCHCPEHLVIFGFFPGIKVVTIQPDDVVKMLVAVTQIPAVDTAGTEAIVARRGDPLAGLDGIKK